MGDKRRKVKGWLRREKRERERGGRLQGSDDGRSLRVLINIQRKLISKIII